MKSKKKTSPKAKPKTRPASRPVADDDVPETALLSLHAALGDLDAAIFAARRALDQALGRPPQAESRRPLPLHELNALRQQLDLAGAPAGAAVARPSIMDIATNPPDDDGGDRQTQRRQLVGVAPAGKLRVD